jgi:HD-GYP domain-containing protein (c-di-GMP phosphodiesterase class II)
MIETLNTAMLELQNAWSARSLYPASHPHIRSSEMRAFEMLRDATERLPEVTLFRLGERVIFDGQTLPASAHLVDGLFLRLHDSGVDQISFRTGLVVGELRNLLDSLVRTDPSQTVSPSTHIRLGFIKDSGRDAPQVAIVPKAGQKPVLNELPDALCTVWQGVHESHSIETDLLGDVVTTLSKMLHDSSSAMLPLASVKQHDEYTFVHTINVAVLSTSLAEAIGFKNRMVHELNMAALLHDVGKRLIPLELLNKVGKFTDEEFELVRRHPVEGARILLATPGVPELAPIVAYEHHVRADGTGYPKVPPGWRLNLASRVVQVADVFDALRTHRPYRPALPIPKIFDLMKQDEGTMFDADLLDIFFRDVVSRGVPEAEEIREFDTVRETPAPAFTPR